MRPIHRTIPPLAAICLLLLVLAPPAPAAETSTAEPAPPQFFRDVTTQSGITFEHNSAPEKKYILESMSGGVALFDYDDDGRPDLYFVDALTVDTADDPTAGRSALYRNRGDGTFEDVTERAGVAHPGWGMGVCVGDADGDGRRDLYVTALGANRLYRNLGDGRFEEVAAKTGVAAGGWSTGCGFADYDRDGDLDLFVSRYVEIRLDELPEFGKDKTCQYRGVAVQCGPRGLPGEGDLLFRNDGDGTFTEVGEAAGVHDPDGYYGLGVAWFDADGDGWLDLFVANDSTPNFLYLNQGDGTFVEDAFPLGVAVSEDGAEQGGMGVAIGDPWHETQDRTPPSSDGDEGAPPAPPRPGIYVTNFAEEYNALYRNDGSYFTDVSFRSGTAPSSLPYVGWGTAFLDLDNDGDEDLIVGNGHVYPQLEDAKLGASAPYRQRRLLYLNRGDGSFEEIGTTQGAVLTQPRVSRGLAVGDLDGDGRVDVVIADLDGKPQILRNQHPDPGHWLLIRLEGHPPNRDAIGAEITVTAGKRSWTRTVRSGTSYLSQNDFRQHVGLGDVETVDEVRVRWPDGSVSTETGVQADRELVIRQPATAEEEKEEAGGEG